MLIPKHTRFVQFGIFVTEEIIVFRKRTGVYCTAALLATELRYAMDRVIFRPKLRIWHTKLPPNIPRK